MDDDEECKAEAKQAKADQAATKIDIFRKDIAELKMKAEEEVQRKAKLMARIDFEMDDDYGPEDTGSPEMARVHVAEAKTGM